MNIKPFTTFISSHFAKILSVFFFILLSAAYVQTFAVFAPGEYLAPNCQPGDAGCYVQTSGGSVAWGSITGAPTALTAFTNDAGYVTASGARTALLGMYEVPLTFSTGLSRSTNTITNNLSTGISGGQSVIGGTASGNNLTLSSTSNATKGKILFGTSAYDEVNNRLGVGDTNPVYPLVVNGAVSISGQLFLRQSGTNTSVWIGSSGSTNANSTENVGIGTHVMNNVSGAINNIGIGQNALSSLAGGDRNIAFGLNSLSSLTDSNDVIAMGYQALSSLNGADDNIAIGYRSQASNTGGGAGAANISIGTMSMAWGTTGADNIAVGLFAYMNGIGDGNIMLGHWAGKDMTTGSSNIIIGRNITAPIPTGSNQINIGNLIYGIGAYGGGGNNLSSTPVAGKIGIGIASPNHTFDVNGNIGLATWSHVNFGAVDGDNGYGFRDNGGAIEFKNNGGSWTAFSSLGGSISVGGSTGQIQYNDSGVLTADANFSWDATTKVLGVMGSIVMKDTDTSNVSINTGTKSFVSGLTDTGNGSYIDIGSSRSLVLASVFTGGNINISDSQSIVVGQAFSGGNLSSGNNNSFTMGTAVSGGSLYGGPNSITMGYADTGAQIYTSGGSSITFGVSSGAGSQLYSGNASFTFGTAYSGGKLHSDGDGSLVFGSAQNDITTELYAGNFSLVFGYAQDANSKIYSNSDTSLIFGSALNGAVLHAGGSSSMVFGYVSDPGSYITAGQSGQAFGTVNGGGHISADNSASLVYGQALNGGVISSTGGSDTLIFGYSDGVDSLIDTQYDAAAAFGYTHAGGQILGNGNGSFAFGYAESTGSQIYTQNSGTLTFGKVDTSGVISGQGGGSLVFGSSEGSGNIYSSGDATLVFGYANGHGGNANYITSGNASGKGSITFGYSDSSVFAGHVESDGRGAFAGGYVQSGDIISVGDGSFAYGDNVMVNDANEYIFGQNGEISLGGDGNSFLIALGGGTRTMLTSNMTFAVGADGMLVLNVDAGSQVATVTGGTTHPFIVATAGGNTCTFDTVSGTFSCPSDFRLKHNITSLDTSAVSKIMSLNPVTFNYNWQKEGDAVIPGFIAQDFETVFPSMVTTDAKTGYKSLSYTPLIPYAIKAIQEMNLRVQSFIPDAMDASGYAKLKVFFAGIVQRGELLIDSVITKKVTSDEINTKKLCIDDVCVTKEQLQQVLNNQNISLPSVESQPVIDSQQVQATIPVEVPPNTSTPEILNHVVPEAAETVPIVDIPSTSQ